MEILQTLLKDKYPEMLSSLVSSGFTENQASNFIPKASEELLSVAQNTDGDASSILGKIDIEGLATKLGIDSSLANTGIQKLLPMVTGGLNTGSVTGMLKSLF